jgi:hypothetical protein
MDLAYFFFRSMLALSLAVGAFALLLWGIWVGARWGARRYVLRYVLDGTERRLNLLEADAFGRSVAYFCYSVIPLILLGIMYFLLRKVRAEGIIPDQEAVQVVGFGFGAMALCLVPLGGWALYDAYRKLARLRDEYRKLGSAGH